MSSPGELEVLLHSEVPLLSDTLVRSSGMSPSPPDLCPSGVHSAGWKKRGKIGDGNEALQK